MSVMSPLVGLVQGLVGGVVTLVILAERAAIEGRSGVTFADLWTALAVGVAVGILPFAITRLVAWRMRRAPGAGSGSQWATSSTFTDRPRGPRPGETFATDTGTGGMDRFDKFTDGARRVLTLAQDEALRFNHSYIGSEHILLGIVRDRDGTAAQVLAGMGVEPTKIRSAVEFIIGNGDRAVAGEVGLTAGGKRVIELAIDEARLLGHRYIGTEHLLIGLVRTGNGVAAGVLESLGVGLDRARAEVIRVTATEGNLG